MERLATFAKNALKDPATRAAIGAAVISGRGVFEKYFRDDRRRGLSHLARDRNAQGDVGDVIRQITTAVDAGLTANRRRGRKLLLGTLGIAGVGAYIWRRLGQTRDSHASSPLDTDTP